MKLLGRISVITGGAMGIGRAIALKFAEEGAKTIIGDINEEEARKTVGEIQAKGGQADYRKTDVSKSEDMKNLIEFAVSQYGGLNIPVNNAAIASFGSVLDLDEDRWDEIMNVNLKSVFLGSKYAIPIMKTSGGGSIINMGSVLSIQGMNNIAAYCTSKGGISLLTKCLALDHGKDKIRVNCICPGGVQTGPGYSRVLTLLDKRKPMGRAGMPDEIANVAAFLASDEASYMTGSLVVVDGGEIAGKLLDLT